MVLYDMYGVVFNGMYKYGVMWCGMVLHGRYGIVVWNRMHDIVWEAGGGREKEKEKERVF